MRRSVEYQGIGNALNAAFVDSTHHVSMTRRGFVGLGGTLLLGSLAALGAIAQTADTATLIVIIDDIPADIDPALAERVVAEFLDRGIPFSCVMPSQRGAALGQIAARHAGLVEIILTIEDDADTRRYFQMRAAEGLRASTVAYPDGVAPVPGRGPIVSVMDRREDQLVDIPAQRSAGFRVLIRPGASGPMTTDFAGLGQMQLMGATSVRLTDPQADFGAQLDEGLNSGQDMMLVLSLYDMAGGGEGPLHDTIAEIAERIETAVAEGRVVAMRPMDHLLAVGPYLSADRAIVLPVGETATENAAIQAFVADLRGAGLPFTVAGATAPAWLVDAEDFCPVWQADADVPAGAARGIGACLMSSDAAPTPAPDGMPGLVIVPAGVEAWNGVRADGRMHLAYREWAQVGLADDTPLEDLVVMIRPGDVMEPLQRQALLLDLQQSVWEGRVRPHTVAGLVEHLMPPEPVLTRLWSTRHRMQSDPPRVDALTDDARAMFLDDARLAWTFINRFTDADTGLCAGTVSGAPGGRVNLEASLWDLASQVQGIIAASAMSIIPKDEARDRVAMLLRNLPAIDLAGLNLPPAMFKTDRTATVTLKGFDFCDTGRFLIALRSAVTSGLITEADAAATRDQWDLAAMIEDGNVFDISGNRRVDVTDSHCTPYIARAFAELGLPLRSPYSALNGGGDAGDLIRLLYSAASIGAMGTEPLLLEAIEQGAAPEVAFLSAVLFDAQLSWYETTGQMKSVSETPLNIEPWFLYQGLRVDRLGQEAWTIQSPSEAERFQTPEFRQKVEILSAKSAYLWAAVHPHPYSDMLVRVMREKGRIDDLGFSVGIFANTLEAVENYSDLNTNGIILSAIAAMHGKPPIP